MNFILAFVYEYTLLVLATISVFLYWLVLVRIFQKKPVQWRTLHIVMIFLFVMLFLMLSIIGFFLALLSSYPYVRLILHRFKLKSEPRIGALK